MSTHAIPWSIKFPEGKYKKKLEQNTLEKVILIARKPHPILLCSQKDLTIFNIEQLQLI